MDDCATSEVMKSIDIEPSLWMPSPMSNDWIDKPSDHDTVDDVSNEIATFRQRSRNKGGRSRREDKLEKPFGKLMTWNTRKMIGVMSQLVHKPAKKPEEFLNVKASIFLKI